MSPRVTVHLADACLLADGFATQHCNGIVLLLKLWGRLRTVSRTHNEGEEGKRAFAHVAGVGPTPGEEEQDGESWGSSS